MQGNRRRDTAPEMRVRRLLHAQGLRYRVDMPLPFDRRRRADIVFPRQQLAVFIDGCFWHGCPVHYVEPRANQHYWQDKVRLNIARDRDTDDRMQELGWRVLRFWEHQASADVVESIKASLSTLDSSD
jgi:DNA mismatch endonuclease (patch repair protein)